MSSSPNGKRSFWAGGWTSQLMLSCLRDVGCRRLTPGIGYLAPFCEDNVNVIRDDIMRVCERGVITSDGVEHEVDVLIRPASASRLAPYGHAHPCLACLVQCATRSAQPVSTPVSSKTSHLVRWLPRIHR